jgi:hypothetical protein
MYRPTLASKRAKLFCSIVKYLRTSTGDVCLGSIRDKAFRDSYGN